VATAPLRSELADAVFLSVINKCDTTVVGGEVDRASSAVLKGIYGELVECHIYKLLYWCPCLRCSDVHQEGVDLDAQRLPVTLELACERDELSTSGGVAFERTSLLRASAILGEASPPAEKLCGEASRVIIDALGVVLTEPDGVLH
jgi:hypothetical protein